MAKTANKCKAKASHRKAQNKYVAKNPKAQAARVKRSNTGSGKRKVRGEGKHGKSAGRPRSGC